MNPRELEKRKQWWSDHPGDLQGYRQRFAPRMVLDHYLSDTRTEDAESFEYLGDEVYHINGDLQELARRIKGLSHYVKNVNLDTQLLEQKLNQHLETKRQPVRL